MLPRRWAKRLKTHESLQRLICRCCVLCCAVAPVLALMFATVYWQSPLHHARLKASLIREINHTCGVVASIRKAETRTRTRLEVWDVELKHPETFERLFYAKHALIEKGSSRWSVTLDSATCNLDACLQLVRSVHDHFLCRADEDQQHVTLTASDFAILEGGKPFLNGGFDLNFAPSPQKSVLIMSLNPGNSDNATIDAKLTRTRDDGQLLTTVQLQTGQLSIPMRIAASLVPNVQAFGSDAAFRGSAVWLIGSDNRMMLRDVTIKNCQWEQLTSSLAYRIAGNGDVFVKEAIAINDQLQQIFGQLTCQNGSISSDWLQMTTNKLGMQLRHGALKDAGIAKSFTQLSLLFKMNEYGLILQGGIDPPQANMPHVVMADGAGPLLYEPNFEPNSQLTLAAPIAWLSADPSENQSGVTQAVHTSNNNRQPNRIAAQLMNAFPIPR
jgi:hypothetical protein